VLIPVPFLSPRLSGLWLALVTPSKFEVGRHLIEGLRNPTVVRDRSALADFSIRPVGVEFAGALQRPEQVGVKPVPDAQEFLRGRPRTSSKFLLALVSSIVRCAVG
jgi:hypothetical protein